MRFGVKTKALCVGLAVAMALAPVVARAATNPFQNIAVAGTLADGTTPFSGTFTVERFQSSEGQLLALGTLSYTDPRDGVAKQASVAWPVTGIDGKTLGGNNPPGSRGGGFGGTETGALSPNLKVLPAALHNSSGSAAHHPGIMLAQQSCNILTLDLGPLHLDLLGLVVDLNAIHLTITAQQGSGNLLGNLLCAVANLLNGTGGGGGGGLTGLLQGISSLLNQILGILNGL